ncbi:MAG: CinA family protein [Promethearchaeota archaeon]
MDIVDRISKILRDFSDKNIKIAVAESCTGGFVSHMLTNVSGASKVFERGIVCYSNQAKIDLIKVDPQIIEKYGAVSERVVKQLAYNVRILSNVEIGIGISGIAGPTGGSLEKPVGLVFIGFSTIEDTTVEKYQFTADRGTFKKLVFEKVLLLLEKFLGSKYQDKAE